MCKFAVSGEGLRILDVYLDIVKQVRLLEYQDVVPWFSGLYVLVVTEWVFWYWLKKIDV